MSGHGCGGYSYLPSPTLLSSSFLPWEMCWENRWWHVIEARMSTGGDQVSLRWHFLCPGFESLSFSGIRSPKPWTPWEWRRGDTPATSALSCGGRPGTSTHAQSSWTSREVGPGGLCMRSVSTSAVQPRARQLGGWRDADPDLDDSPGFREQGRVAAPLFPCPSFATESTTCRRPGTRTPPPQGGPFPGVPGPVSLGEQLCSPNFCPRALLDPWYLRFFPRKILLLAKSYRLLSEFELQNFNDTQLLKNTNGEIDQLRGWKKRAGNRIMYSIL